MAPRSLTNLAEELLHLVVVDVLRRFRHGGSFGGRDVVELARAVVALTPRACCGPEVGRRGRSGIHTPGGGARTAAGGGRRHVRRGARAEAAGGARPLGARRGRDGRRRPTGGRALAGRRPGVRAAGPADPHLPPAHAPRPGRCPPADPPRRIPAGPRRRRPGPGAGAQAARPSSRDARPGRADGRARPVARAGAGRPDRRRTDRRRRRGLRAALSRGDRRPDRVCRRRRSVRRRRRARHGHLRRRSLARARGPAAHARARRDRPGSRGLADRPGVPAPPGRRDRSRPLAGARRAGTRHRGRVRQGWPGSGRAHPLDHAPVRS